VKEPWYESNNPDRVSRALAGRGVIWVTAIAIFVMLLGGLVWGIRVATSDIKGQGDAITRKNSGTNRIAAQERFEDMYQDVLAADRRIDVLADAVKANPKSNVAQINLTGAVTYCIEVAADYDAEARKYTAEDFRSVDLPEQIDALDPTTDCQETTR